MAADRRHTIELGNLAAGADTNTALEDASLRPTVQRVSSKELFRSIFGVAVFFFTDKDSRFRAWSLAAAITVTMLVFTGMTLYFVGVQGQVQQALHDRDQDGFYSLVINVSFVIAVYCILSLGNDILRGAMALEWRRSITRHLFGSYIGDSQAYYRLKLQGSGIDNPDQRIAQDVGAFTTNVLTFALTMIKAGLQIGVFSPKLYGYSPKLFVFVIFYSLGLNVLSFCIFGGPLTRLSRLVLGQEASLRFALVRVREHAEPIAFYQGASYENEYCHGLFGTLMSTLYRKLIIESIFGSCMIAAGLFANIAPYVILAGEYFEHQIDFGDMTVAAGALGILIQSFSSAVNQLSSITDMAAQAVRVKQLWDVVDAMKAEAKVRSRGESDSSEQSELGKGYCYTKAALTPTTAETQSAVSIVEVDGPMASDDGPVVLEVNHVTLQGARGHVPLVTDLSFKLLEDQSLIVTGPSGIGKSSLLRAIGGLWAAGEGTIRRRAATECFFVPQEPYLCEGSLRDNAIYPRRAAGEDSEASEDADEPSDLEITKALQDVHLGYLKDRFTLDTTVAFDSILSGGERQRLGFVRLLLRRNLRFSILDEATSALDVENENRVYGLLQERVSCYVSVAHRPNVVQFHTHKLTLDRKPDQTCTWHFGRSS